ncbi:hypothetical protein D9M69_683200 [compost metagenome]
MFVFVYESFEFFKVHQFVLFFEYIIGPAMLVCKFYFYFFGLDSFFDKKTVAGTFGAVYIDGTKP